MMCNIYVLFLLQAFTEIWTGIKIPSLCSNHEEIVDDIWRQWAQ